MKIGRGVSELWRVENHPLPLTRPMAYTTACTTVQAVTSRDVWKSYSNLLPRPQRRNSYRQSSVRNGHVFAEHGAR